MLISNILLGLLFIISFLTKNEKCAYLMTGGNKQVKIWNPSNGSLLSSFSSEPSAIRYLKRIPDFRLAVALDNFNIKIYSLLYKTLLAELKSHQAIIKCLLLINNNTLVSGSVDGNIKFWDMNSYILTRTLTQTSNQVFSLEYISFKGLLASGLYSGSISIWNLTSYSIVKTLSHGNYLSLDCLLLLNNEKLASGDNFQFIKIWNIDTLTINRTISSKSASYMVLLNENLIGLITSSYSNDGFYAFNFSDSTNLPVLKKKDTYYYYDCLIAINTSLVAISDTGFNVHLFDLVKMTSIKISGFGNNIEAMELVEICPNNECPYSHLSNYQIKDSEEFIAPIGSDQINQETQFSQIYNQQLTTLTSESSVNNSDYPTISTSGSILSNSSSHLTLSNQQITTLTSESSVNNSDYPTISTSGSILSNSSSHLTLSNQQITTKLKNYAVNQFILNLKGSTFQFADLGSPNSSIPLSILTTTFDLNNCISQCSNHGKCKFIDNKFSCVCDPDWSGQKCEIDQRPCSANIQCLNSIKCENILNESKPNSGGLYIQNYYDFKCHCKQNFVGRRCENKINICANETCSGNGLCSIKNENQINETIECKCFGIGLYEGEYCQIKTNKKKVIEITTRTTYYIAILVLVLLYTIVVLSDLHNLYMSRKNKPIRSKEKLKKEMITKAKKK